MSDPACNAREIETFIQVVSSWRPVLQANGSIQRCPDVFVGPVSEIQHASGPRGLWDKAVGLPITTDCQRIVLIMESPHVDEFDSGCVYAPWPANGRTGKNIQRFLGQVATDIGAAEDSALVLFNSVPFQCSQGNQKTSGKSGSAALWKSRRDQIFREYWEACGKASFLPRLKKWYRPGDVLINACTVGGSGQRLREMVEEVLRDGKLFDMTPPYYHRRWHPSRWWSLNAARTSWRGQSQALQD